MAKPSRKTIAIGATLGALGLVGLIAALMRDDDDDDDGRLTPRPAKPHDPDAPPIFTPVPADPVEPPTFTPRPAKRVDPKRIIDDYFGPGTRTGTLYQIRKEDWPIKVARRALDGDPRSEKTINRGHPALDDYVRLMTSVIMNANAYGVYWDEDQKWGRPKWETVEDEDGDRITIHFAYLPKNYDNLAELRAGRPPRRAVSLDGKGGIAGGSYGLIWLPDAYVRADDSLAVVDDDLPAALRAFMPGWYEV